MEIGKIEAWVQEAIEENESLFLIDLSIEEGGKIKIIVDGDQGVPLSECIRISRHVEGNLDRDTEDFSLEVSSPNITEPLVNKRQYNKNLGRTLKVKTAEGEFEGKLAEIVEEGILLQWKAREPKPVGKGKVTVEKTKTLRFEDIQEAKVKIIF